MRTSGLAQLILELPVKSSNMPRSAKRIITVVADLVALPLCGMVAQWIVAGSVDRLTFAHAVIPLLAGIPMFILTGFYRSVVRFMGLELIIAAFKSVTVATAFVVLYFGLSASWAFAVRFGAAFWLLSVVYVAGSRFAVRLVLQSANGEGDRVVIYGAGDAGARLAGAIRHSRDFNLVGFIDDNPSLRGAVVNGYNVHTIDSLTELVNEFGVSRVLLALPSASRRRRQEILNRLEPFAVHVQTMPDFVDIISGKARVDDIREVEIKDLLGRDSVPPHPDLLDACIRGKSVMVTGAGGSIGSELCLQIVRLGVRKLLLLDSSEAALYTVHQRVNEIVNREKISIEIYPLIGSVHHTVRMRDVMVAYRVDTVYHAAAYKHVPLVEHNMIEGIYNNVFGTLHSAEAAIDAGVKSFVLVSTDKAVKPTNVMGATKRMAELVLQGLNESRKSGTTFSMVRFGNVLASSGSVVPLFREQIRRGGPVTVTHPEIYRYFMTIPEAASLVIQAGSMARGGDVFVLDMGESVRIRDLAEKMIHLMGLTVRSKDNPDGDIEIQYTGLRPAEKLYEELLIGDNVMGTEHPGIMRAEEEYLAWRDLKSLLDEMWIACRDLNCIDGRNLLLKCVSGYSAADVVSDLVWQERNRGTSMHKLKHGGGNVTPIETVRAAASSRPSFKSLDN